MKERPILFSGSMVRAILSGQKTVTRRVVKTDLACNLDEPRGQADIKAGYPFVETENGYVSLTALCPHGQPGDRLWVRESFAECYDYCEHPEMPGAPTEHFHLGWHYRADGEPKREELDGFLSHWRPSIHMPRSACRILLEITAARVERLHGISTEQIIAEGLSTNLREHDAEMDLRKQWKELWESTGGDWESNPWVWVVEFKRVTP